MNCDLCDLYGVNFRFSFSLSHHHVAKRRGGGVGCTLAKGHAIHSTTIHTGPYYPFHSEAGSILSSARMREGVELCHSPPKRFSPPVVHNQESPLVSSCASCECASGLYSTQGILRLDSRSLGKRRRTEEKAHSHQKRIVTPIHRRRLFIRMFIRCHWQMWV
eukprot:COSAG01_NODE_4649_length_4850_cov_8.199958_1_plen_162_part_00